MKIYKLIYEKIDWNAYYSTGYNYIISNGTIYGMSEEIVRNHCPITEKEGKIVIEVIDVYEEEK